jgi:S1-C subfamily serine protease
VPGGLAERRTQILNGIQFLERLGRQDYANDIRTALEAASRAIGSSSAAAPTPAPKSTYRIGTGFAVRPDGLLVTASHVVDGARSIEVSCSGGARIPALVEQASSLTHLATIRLRGSSPPAYLRVADSKAARVGERVFTVGFPTPGLLGGEAKFTEGVISSMSGPGNEASLMQITVPVQGGNSGGALVNEAGEVVGVVIATASARAFLGKTGNLPQNVNWAIKVSYLLPLLDTSPSQPRAPERAIAIERAIRASCMIIAEVENE